MAQVDFIVHANCSDPWQIRETLIGLRYIKNVEYIEFKDEEDRKIYNEQFK